MIWAKDGKNYYYFHQLEISGGDQRTDFSEALTVCAIWIVAEVWYSIAEERNERNVGD
jgi:hypothetical protein